MQSPPSRLRPDLDPPTRELVLRAVARENAVRARSGLSPLSISEYASRELQRSARQALADEESTAA